MARHRVIKPEFFSSEQVVECSPTARLLFVGMWCYCDDGGVHPASAARLKMEVFPADPFTTSQVSEWVAELHKAGLLETYRVDGKDFWRVTGWHHQKIDKPTYSYPLSHKFGEESASKRRRVVDASAAERRGAEGSGAEGKGTEGSGVSMGGGKTVGISSDPPKANGHATAPPSPPPSQPPKRFFVREEEPLELPDIDWERVIAMAEAVARKIKPLTPQDRRMWIKASLLAHVRFSEAWLMDSIDAVLNATETRRTKQAHFVAVLKSKASEEYDVDRETYEAIVGRVEIPDEIWKSGVLEIRR